MEYQLKEKLCTCRLSHKEIRKKIKQTERGKKEIWKTKKKGGKKKDRLKREGRERETEVCTNIIL